MHLCVSCLDNAPLILVAEEARVDSYFSNIFRDLRVRGKLSGHSMASFLRAGRLVAPERQEILGTLNRFRYLPKQFLQVLIAIDKVDL